MQATTFYQTSDCLTLQHIMKLISKYIRNNYLILTVKLLILSLFIFRLIHGNIETSVYWNFVSETGSGLRNYLKALKGMYFYIPTIILLIPLIGIFVSLAPNKFGVFF